MADLKMDIIPVSEGLVAWAKVKKPLLARVIQEGGYDGKSRHLRAVCCPRRSIVFVGVLASMPALQPFADQFDLADEKMLKLFRWESKDREPACLVVDVDLRPHAHLIAALA